jgi:hypothetical protein
VPATELCRPFPEEWLLVSRSLKLRRCSSVELTDELDANKLKTTNNHSQAESLEALVKFYHSVVKFFIKVGNKDTSTNEEIDSKLTAYKANPNTSTTASLQTSLKGLR